MKSWINCNADVTMHKPDPVCTRSMPTCFYEQNVSQGTTSQILIEAVGLICIWEMTDLFERICIPKIMFNGSIQGPTKCLNLAWWGCYRSVPQGWTVCRMCASQHVVWYDTWLYLNWQEIATLQNLGITAVTVVCYRISEYKPSIFKP